MQNEQKEVKKMNNKKTNKTRRQRGYAFESSIVKMLYNSTNWIGKRLGSPSTNLPDVMGINNDIRTIIAIEAKSTHQTLAYVPYDQIERCSDWINHFQVYDKKMVVLAFKFGQITGKRKLKIIYKVYPIGKYLPRDVRCDYEGNIWIKILNRWLSVKMEDFVL